MLFLRGGDGVWGSLLLASGSVRGGPYAVDATHAREASSTHPRTSPHAVEATMSLTLRLLDGVEETGHTTSTPSTRHLEEGSALPTRRRNVLLLSFIRYTGAYILHGGATGTHYYK